MGVFRESYAGVPIYASEATTQWMRDDPLTFYPLARQADPDYPTELTYPDHAFDSDAVLALGGLRFQTLELVPGESETATVYFEPSTGALFSGDVVNNRATPALLEGHSCGWLTNIDQVRDRFPNASVLYPGHGDPGDPAPLLEQQRAYLDSYRELVRPAVGRDSPDGETVSPQEQESIIDSHDRTYPGYERVASISNLQELNINAVAGELRISDQC